MAAYQKDFNGWNKQKKRLHQNKRKTYFDKREVWWCALGVNVGFEQDGAGYAHQRPVVILKKLSRETCLVVPLTTSNRTHPLRLPAGVTGGKESYAILSQVRVVDVGRFMEKVGTIEIEKFDEIRKTIKDML
ncbi:MAG: type II toxin-antitoxin system PemK/MazF family toxin [Patescibacteria group bacterium]